MAVRKLKFILIAILLVPLASTIWQIAGCEIAHYQLQDELHDVAAMTASRIGLDHPKSDDDLCDAVIHRAQAHHIELSPEQIRIDRSGPGSYAAVSIEVKYDRRIVLPGISFPIHFIAVNSN